MQQHVVSFMTRVQARRLRIDCDNNNMTTEVSSTPRPDQPKVVEILKRPIDGVELILFCNKNTLKRIEKFKHFTSDNGNCKFVPEKSAIFIISQSLSTVSVLMREL